MHIPLKMGKNACTYEIIHAAKNRRKVFWLYESLPHEYMPYFSVAAPAARKMAL